MGEIHNLKLDEILYYDETSPSALRWIAPTKRCRGSHNRVAGAVAGSDKNRDRWQFIIKGKHILGHHIVWWLFHREEVQGGFVIDHIDRNPRNNTIQNLRVIPLCMNPRNATKYTNNTTGTTGVSYRFQVDARDGSTSERFVAMWNDLNGKRKSKSFSILRYGHEQAFHLACDYRNKMIQELNAQGAGYSDTHGK